MYKKTLLSIAVASTLTLTGCLEENNETPSKTQNEGVTTVPQLGSDLTESGDTEAELGFITASFPVFSPATGELPIPNDLIFQKDSTATSTIEQSDGSFAISGSDAADASPPVVALENLSGAGLSAPIDIELVIGAGKTLDTATVNGTSFLLTGVPASPVSPNPNQTVFLLELDYASDNPLAALSMGEAPTIPEAVTASTMAYAASEDPALQAAGLAAVGAISAIAANPKYDATVITRTKSDGSEANYIRINPLTPLNPGKRYVVALTDGIKTVDGASLIRHPGAAAYDALSDVDKGLASSALAPVKDLINKLWEATTESYFEVTNAARASDDALSEENIIFSISLTTSNDTKVVDYMVEPNTWITDTLASKVKTAAAGAAIAGGAASYDSIKTVVDGAYGSFVATSVAPTNENLTAFLSDNCSTETYPAGAAQFACAGIALTGLLQTPQESGGLGLTLPTPAADTTIDFDSQRNVRTVSAFVTDELAPLATETSGLERVAVNISEGSMGIPYYSGIPTTRGVSDGSEVNLVDDWWKADATIATGVDALLRDPANPAVPAVPQAITTGTNYVQSNVVNSFFPFPAKNSDEEIPVLAVYPADTTNMPVGGYKTLIYQHGITTDRSVALALGTAIVANSGGTIAVLAIDQPLHGIDAISDQGRLDLAAAFLAGGQSAGLPVELAPGDDNNQALVDGTLATDFVTLSLNGAGIIDATDGLNATESGLIGNAFDNTLATNVVIGSLQAAAVIDITDGIDAGEQALIDSAFDGTLTSDVVTGGLQTAALIDFTDGIDAGEQGLIDAVIAGATGNPGLAALEGAAASLTALEAAATTTLPGLQQAAQGLALMQATVANGASQIPGLGQGSADERHFGFAAVNLAPTLMDFDAGTVGTSSSDGGTNTGSGAMTINIGNFLTSRDNFRQQIVDLMTLRLSIPTMDIDGEDGSAMLDGDNVHFLAHSLGTFNGIPFVEIANNTATTADDIKSANFLTPGGNISRLAENSEIFAPSILLGLNSVAGLNRGDADLEAFMSVLQASLDAFDPINFVGGLSSTATTTKALFTEVVGDIFIPNSAVPANDIINPDTMASFGEGTDAPLAGTSPLQTISGATSIDSSSELGINFIRFESDSGALHTTPAAAATDEEKPVFAEVVFQATSIVTSDGASVGVDDEDLIVDVAP
jgi:hypothetical protein